MQDSQLSVLALEDAVTLLFSNNFDATTKTCLITLCKILDNLIAKPGDSKVRTIRLANPTFHAKVGSPVGGVAFLEACGFVKQQGAAGLLSSAAGEAQLVLAPEVENTQHLQAARRLLATKAVQDLGMKPEELPPIRPPPSVASRPQSESASSPMEFDPYAGHRHDAKSAAIGANLGPDANYVSTTERQLTKLRQDKERLEKMAWKELPDRQWQALFPGQSMPESNTATTSATTSNGKSDSSLLAARMQKQQAEQYQRDHGGFTTAAMREVERLKNQKVYSHAVVTIQFPDGCRLMGRFLPTETIGAVITAVRECLDPTEDREFDLFVAPPRRVLPVKESLQKLQLVPAAKVFCSWKSKSAGTAGQGTRLKASFYEKDPSSNGQAVAFPSAAPIVQDTTATKKEAASSKPKVETAEEREAALMRRMMGGKSGKKKKSKTDETSGGSSSTNNKPKWFK